MDSRELNLDAGSPIDSLEPPAVLSAAQRDATAAIFTLALHAVAIRGGGTLAEGGRPNPAGRPWGLPQGELERPPPAAKPLPAPPAPQQQQQAAAGSSSGGGGGYKFGDFTRRLGQSISGDKNYRFGDITKRALLGVTATPPSSEPEASSNPATAGAPGLAPAPAGGWGRELAQEQLPRLYECLGLPGADRSRLLSLPRAPSCIDEVHLHPLDAQLAWDAAVYAGMLDPALYQAPDPAAAAAASAAAATGPARVLSIKELRTQSQREQRQAQEAALVAASGWEGDDWYDGAQQQQQQAAAAAPGPAAAAAPAEASDAQEEQAKEAAAAGWDGDDWYTKQTAPAAAAAAAAAPAPAYAESEEQRKQAAVAASIAASCWGQDGWADEGWHGGLPATTTASAQPEQEQRKQAEEAALIAASSWGQDAWVDDGWHNSPAPAPAAAHAESAQLQKQAAEAALVAASADGWEDDGWHNSSAPAPAAAHTESAQLQKQAAEAALVAASADGWEDDGWEDDGWHSGLPETHASTAAAAAPAAAPAAAAAAAAAQSGPEEQAAEAALVAAAPVPWDEGSCGGSSWHDNLPCQAPAAAPAQQQQQQPAAAAAAAGRGSATICRPGPDNGSQHPLGCSGLGGSSSGSLSVKTASGVLSQTFTERSASIIQQVEPAHPACLLALRSLLQALATEAPAERGNASPLLYRYDARSRAALVRMCKVLRVPAWSLWQMEQQRAQQLQVPVSRQQQLQQQQLLSSGGSDEQEGGQQQQQQQAAVPAAATSSLSGWSKFKVGAAAAAGGGLMLMSAGVAAPVLAGISGALMGVVPVAGVAAGAVVQSSLGVAAITAGLGYYGAAKASRAALQMVGGVQQFGFLDLDACPAAAASDPSWEGLDDLEEILGPQGTDTAAALQPGTPAAAARVKSGRGTAAGSQWDCSDEQAPVPEAPPLLGMPDLLPVPLRPPPQQQQQQQAAPSLSVVICVSGYVGGPAGFTAPWREVASGSGMDRYALVFDASVLRAVGWSIAKFARDEAVAASASLLTMAGGAVAMPLGVLQAISMINAPWRLALRRSAEAGTMLGRLLAAGAHGGRPVTLLGFSMGARVVFHALLELSRLGRRGIVENAVLLGAPLSQADTTNWSCGRAVVANRLVNAYSPKDGSLALIYRYKAMSATAAGLAPVEVAGVENVDVSDVITSHADYERSMPVLLARLGLPV